MFALTFSAFTPSARSAQPPIVTNTLWVGHGDKLSHGIGPPDLASFGPSSSACPWLTMEAKTPYGVPWGVERVNAPWTQFCSKGAGINVVIIDGGIDYNHPDLKANYKGGWNFIANNNDTMDDQSESHGTQVAGIVAARDNDFGILGVAPRVNLYVLKVFNSTGYTSDDFIAKAVEWAIVNVSPPRIISMSFICNDPNDTLEPALTHAWSNGSLLVAAVPNNYTESAIAPYPWNHTNVIAVTRVDENNKYVYGAAGTYNGSEISLSAPGQNINSTVRNAQYDTASGTSFATPHVAGVAALIWSMDPSLKNQQVRDVLEKSARDLGDPLAYGHGLVDAYGAYTYLREIYGFPVKADPINAVDEYSRELIFNSYDTLIAGNGEQYLNFVPRLATNVPPIENVTMTVTNTTFVNEFDPSNPSSMWTDGVTSYVCVGWVDRNATGKIGQGDVLYLKTGTEWRTWYVEGLSGTSTITLNLWRGRYTFHIRTSPVISFFDENGNVVDTFEIADAKYSFKRGLVQRARERGSSVWMFYNAFFDQMDSSHWTNDTAIDLAHLIDNAVEVSGNDLMINVGIPSQLGGFMEALSSTWASIISKEFSTSIGCWDGNLYTTAKYGGPFPDWWIDWNGTAASPYDGTPFRYAGTGPYHVATVDSLGLMVILQKNPSYWRGWPASGCSGSADTVEIYYIANWGIRKWPFLCGDIDICDVPGPNTTEPSVDGIKMIKNLPEMTKWLWYWVKGWYYNPMYPGDYYYPIWKTDDCWFDVSGLPPGVSDGIVNMRDIQYLIMRFNAKAPVPGVAPDPRWVGVYGANGCVDPSGDRTCNMRDVQGAILHFNHKQNTLTP